MTTAFLWSGPALSPKKAKISWAAVCSPKQEGGLGIKSLLEANKVSCLKLIWKIVSRQPSLWVNWIWENLIQNECFWSVKDNNQAGSWMWKKLLKYRELAATMHKIKIKSGSTTSFWFDHWSNMGHLYDLTGRHGVIDLGIPLDATVDKALQLPRRRRHRTEILTSIEDKIKKLSLINRVEGKDISLWRVSATKFKNNFTTKATSNVIRTSKPRVQWYKCVWFAYATPKYSLMWLAIHNRLSTGDIIKKWKAGHNSKCIMCDNMEVTRNHLFFSCRYSVEIWKNLAAQILLDHYSTDWNILTTFITNPNLPSINTFLLRYVFQTTLYHIWH